MTLRSMKVMALLGMLSMWLAGCASDVVQVGQLAPFAHRLGVFEMQAPKTWKQGQDALGTEALAAFSDPSGRAEIIGYAGLLDHRFTNDERAAAVQGLIKNLLNAPADLKFEAAAGQPDGSYTTSLTFTRNGVLRSGQALFRDGRLSLSGVIISGPQTQWPTLQAELQPVVDSFTVKPEYVEGTYFEPVDGSHFVLVAPTDWPRTAVEGGAQIRAPQGELRITVAQKPLTGTLSADALVTASVARARQLLGSLELSGSQLLPDGRAQLTLSAGSRQIIGYVDHKDEMLITLFFEIPADRAADYQPIIDFIYSTLVTGKP